MTQDSKESVLSRWSRRKFEAGSEAQAADPGTTSEAEAGNAALVTEVETSPVLTDADMPDIESLDSDSDFSGFMSAGVSDELRNLALRKLFRAPVFNIRDGLDEYDEDYTTFEKLGDIVTSDMKHRIEMQEQKLREKLAAESEAVADEEEALEAIDDEDHEADEDDAELPPVTVAAADPETPSRQAADDEQ